MVELEHLSDISHPAERTPASEICQTQGVAPVAVVLQSPPCRSSQTSSQPSSISWARTQSPRTSELTGSPAPTSRRPRFQIKMNTIVALVTMTTLPLTIVGVWAAVDALKVSQWTQLKDAFEWCTDHGFEYPGCEVFRNKSLSIPNNPRLFGRSWETFHSDNEPSLSMQQYFWARSTRKPLVSVVIYFCFLVLQLTILWRSFSRFMRCIHSLVRAMPAEHEANYQQLESGVVPPESSAPISTAGPGNKRNQRRQRRRQRLEEEALSPKPTIVVTESNIISPQSGQEKGWYPKIRQEPEKAILSFDSSTATEKSDTTTSTLGLHGYDHQATLEESETVVVTSESSTTPKQLDTITLKDGQHDREDEVNRQKASSYKQDTPRNTQVNKKSGVGLFTLANIKGGGSSRDYAGTNPHYIPASVRSSSSAKSDPYYREYRSSTAENYTKSTITRGNIFVHQERAHGYSSSEPHPRYSGSSSHRRGYKYGR